MPRHRKQLNQSQAYYRVNWPLLAATVVVGIAGVAGLYFWREFQLGRVAVAFKDRAETLAADAKWFLAADYLDRYVSLRPEDNEARVRLATTYDRARPENQPNDRSVQLYYQALAVAPENEKAGLRQRTVELLLQLGRFNEAERQAQALLDADPDDPRALQSLAVALFRQFQVGELGARRERVVKVQQEAAQESQEPDWYRVCAVGEALERGVAANPADVELTAMWVRTLRQHSELLGDEQRKKPEFATRGARQQAADQHMEQLVQATDEKPDGYLTRYLYRQQHDLPGAEQDLEAALKRGPDDPRVLTAAAGYFDQQARDARGEGLPAEKITALIQRSRECYERLGEVSEPARIVAQLGIADLLVQEGKISEAIEKLEDASQQLEKPNERLLLRIAELYVADERYEAAAGKLKTLEKLADNREMTNVSQRLNPLDQARMLLQAAVLLEQGQPMEAIVACRPLAAAGDNELNIPRRARELIAVSYRRLQQWDQAAEAYEQILRDHPDARQERLLAAANWMSADLPERAIPHYMRLVLQTRQRSVRFDYAVALYSAQLNLPPAERDWAEFEAVLQGLQNERAAAPAVGSPAADAPDAVAVRDESLAHWRVALLDAAYRQVRARESGKPEDEEQGRQQALGILGDLEKDLEQHETDKADHRVWLELALRYEQLGEPAEADRALARARELDAQSSAWFVLAAQIYNGRGDEEKARNVLREGLQSLAGPRREPVQLALVKLDRETGDFQSAETMLQSLLTEEEGDLNRLNELADLALEQGDLETARDIETRLEAAEGSSGVAWRVVRARRLLALIRNAKLEDPTEHPEFEQLVRDESYLLAQRPLWSTVHLLSAQRAELARQQGVAIDGYRRAVELGDRRPEVLGRLIELLNRRGEYDEAEKYLNLAASRGGRTDSMSVQGIISSLGRQDRAGALKRAERQVEQTPNDASAQAWYGRVLSLNDQAVEAEAAFLAATRLDPADVGNWNLLLGHYLRNDQADKVRQLLDRMDQDADLQPAELALAKAQGFNALGDTGQADTYYKQASELDGQNIDLLKKMSNFYRRVDLTAAIDATRRIRQLEPTDLAARRTLATLLARRGQPSDWSEALDLLQAEETTETDALDLQLRGLLLLRRSRDPALKPAPLTETLEEIERIRQQLESQTYLEDGERLLLAQIYERQSQLAEDDEVRAVKRQAMGDQLRSLCRRSDPQSAHLRSLVRFLLQPEGDLKEAARWQEELERVAPDDSQTVDLRVQLLKAEGKGDQVPETLQAYADRVEDRLEKPAQRVQLYLAIGQMALRAELPQVAENWARQAMELEPRAYRAVVQALVAQKKPREAVELCQEVCRRTKSVDAAQTLAATLVEVKAGEELLRGSESLLNEVLVSREPSTSLLMSVANVYFTQGRTADTIALYERAVQLDPRNALAMNNLATLLAEQPGRGPEALQHIDRAMQISGRSPALLDTKATIFLHEGRAREAVPLLEEATAGEQVDPRYLLHLASAYHRTGQDQPARDALKRAEDGEIRETLLTEKDKQQLDELERNLKPRS